MNEIKERELSIEFARQGCVEEYGFAPDPDKITLLERSMNNDRPQYVLFRIGRFEYSYDGITVEKRVAGPPFRKYMIVGASGEGTGVSFADTYDAARGIRLDIECGLGGYAEIYERKEDDGLSWYEFLES